MFYSVLHMAASDFAVCRKLTSTDRPEVIYMLGGHIDSRAHLAQVARRQLISECGKAGEKELTIPGPCVSETSSTQPLMHLHRPTNAMHT